MHFFRFPYQFSWSSHLTKNTRETHHITKVLLVIIILIDTMLLLFRCSNVPLSSLGHTAFSTWVLTSLENGLEQIMGIICVMIDYVTKWHQAYPLKIKSASEVTDCIIILTDQESVNFGKFGIFDNYFIESIVLMFEALTCYCIFFIILPDTFWGCHSLYIKVET